MAPTAMNDGANTSTYTIHNDGIAVAPNSIIAGMHTARRAIDSALPHFPKSQDITELRMLAASITPSRAPALHEPLEDPAITMLGIASQEEEAAGSRSLVRGGAERLRECRPSWGA
jgi:hypothetical protein